MATEAPRNPDGVTEDELWASLEGQVGAERASTLVDIINLMTAREDYSQALPLADTAVEAALDSDNEQMQARALSTRGIVNYALDRFEESADDHLRAAKLFERYDNIIDTYYAYFNASWSFEACDQLDRALECVDIAITSAAQLEDPKLAGNAHEQRADVITKLDRSDEEFLEALSNARLAFRQASDARAVMRMDERVAYRFVRMGNYEGAVNLFRDCLTVSETIDAPHAAFLSYQLGRTLRMQGKAREGMQMLQQPLQFNLEQQNVQQLGATYYELAQCEAALDNTEEAITLASKARAHYDMAGFDSGVADVDESRSIWLHVSGRYDEAIAINQLLVETTSGVMRFMARARMADNYRCSGNLEKALELSSPQDSDHEFFLSGGWLWRECTRAWILESMECRDEAWAIARACLELDMKNANAYTQAKFSEMMGDSYFMSDEPDNDEAHNWWARAIAFYLAAESFSDARRLSTQFLPDTAEAKVQ